MRGSDLKQIFNGAQKNSFPEATRIVLRPHSSTFYESNIKDELEIALTEYGVLQLGMTVPIKIKAINNIIDFDIVALEPASIVLMQEMMLRLSLRKHLMKC